MRKQFSPLLQRALLLPIPAAVLERVQELHVTTAVACHAPIQPTVEVAHVHIWCDSTTLRLCAPHVGGATVPLSVILVLVTTRQAARQRRGDG